VRRRRGRLEVGGEQDPDHGARLGAQHAKTWILPGRDQHGRLGVA
jgi:hypothetical protein